MGRQIWGVNPARTGLDLTAWANQRAWNVQFLTGTSASIFCTFSEGSYICPGRNPCLSSVRTRFPCPVLCCRPWPAWCLWSLHHFKAKSFEEKTSCEPCLRTTDTFINPDDPWKHQFFIRKEYPGVPIQAAAVARSQILLKVLLTQPSEEARGSQVGSALSSPPSPSKDKTWEVQGTLGNASVFSSLMEVQLLDSPCLTTEHVWKYGSLNSWSFY